MLHIVIEVQVNDPEAFGLTSHNKGPTFINAQSSCHKPGGSRLMANTGYNISLRRWMIETTLPILVGKKWSVWMDA